MSKNKLIPELRFPEFKNEGDWCLKTLDEVGDVVASGDLDTNSFSSLPTDEHIYPIYSNSVSNEGLYGYNNYFKYNPNSVTITARGTLGVAFVRKTKFIGIGRLLVVSHLKNTDAIFLKENWNQFAKVPLENGGIPQLTAVKAKSVTLLFPKEKEQQKIASCLSSLDEVIAAHSQKLDLLKDHKKGLMQNLFPQEGETVPKYRFKEFEKDGEWVEKTIEQVAKVSTGNKDTQNKVENGKYPFFVRSQTVERINSYSFDGEAILTSGDGVGVGKNFHYINGKFDFHQRVYCIYDFLNDVCGEFVFMFFSQHFNERVMKMSAKNSVDSVRMAMITEMPICLPSKKEQQEIASCLSSLDALISAQADKIEQLKLHKKGLMQGLFPKIND